MPERRAFSCNHSQQARAFLASPLALTETERDRERDRIPAFVQEDGVWNSGGV